MNKSFLQLTIFFSLFCSVLAHGTTLYVDLNSANPTPPYSDWNTAATNIQDAIDASISGDFIWVTNGTYQTGGRVMAGNLTNRIALNKTVTVQSVNGPFVTAILGAGTTNGTAAIRCAWLTNNAALVGFTLMLGATRSTGDPLSLESGGGIWCASSNAFVSDCVIVSNTSYFNGGGAYQGTLNACLISSNAIFANATGGAAYIANLNNCTVVSNSCRGVAQCQATNSIIYYNSAAGNYTGGNLSYCCTIPAAAGNGNFTNAPQLLPDRIHLASGSACIGAGTSAIANSDILGNTWANPPSVGCSEATGKPFLMQPQIKLTSVPLGFTVGNFYLSGTGPFTLNWLKNGELLQDDVHYNFTHTTNLVAIGVNFADAGSYQLVASNSFGWATSAVAQVVVHCVSSSSANPTPPYTNWATAATQIQDAIDASSAGEIVLVNNGIYSYGGKVISGDLTNRVALDKALIVTSVNGFDQTVIEGQWDSASTNGPGSVRCAWLADGAVLNGFTLRNGATRGGNFITVDLQYGGGAWLSTNAVITDCVLTNNRSLYAGGGMAFGTANNCFLVYNNSRDGGGAYSSRLTNCSLRANHSLSSIGGAGVSWCKSYNCIIAENYYSQFGNDYYQLANYPMSSLDAFTNCCVSPQPSRGTNNITASPLFLDAGFHLAPASPCRGAGNLLYVSGNDLDDEPFANPPSMGCDEFIEANMTGPLSLTFLNPTTEIVVNHRLFFQSLIQGRVSKVEWSFGDGPAATNLTSSSSHIWTNTGTYPVILTVYNADHPEGVSSNLMVTVDPFLSPSLVSANAVSNGFQFSFFAQAYVPYNIQYATNLSAPITWQTVVQPIYQGTNGTVTVSYPLNTNGVRFYRVLGQ